MRSRTFESEWFDDQPYPGPDEPTDYEYRYVWYRSEPYPGPENMFDMSDLVKYVKKLFEESSRNTEATAEKLNGIGKALKPVFEVMEPPRPRNVGPRHKRTFDRQGRRKF